MFVNDRKKSRSGKVEEWGKERLWGQSAGEGRKRGDSKDV